MITGFNTEFRFNNRVYHVQTEDKGLSNPKIQTLIYVRGEVLDSFNGDYSDLLKNPPVSEAEIMRRMEDQHKQIVSDVKSGKYDFTPADQSFAEEKVFNNRPLEDVIVEYLQAEGDKETMEMILKKPLTPKFGTTFTFSIIARLCNSKFPVPEAKVSVKLISSFKKAIELLTGKTDASGGFSASIDLPPSQPGHCAILLSCFSEHGNDEIRAFISV
ncbi:MAG: hypothetical protein FWG02_03365 [Holophagaceae bacterium]|nr:hypothetical protein [Holophagaceae bacterium]